MKIIIKAVVMLLYFGQRAFAADKTPLPSGFFNRIELIASMFSPVPPGVVVSVALAVVLLAIAVIYYIVKDK